MAAERGLGVLCWLDEYAMATTYRMVVFKFAPLLAIRLFGGGAAFLSTFIIAKYLGAGEAGLYFLVYSLIAIVSAVSRVGVDSTIVKFVGGRPEDAWSVFYRVAQIMFAPSVILLLGMYFGASYIALNLFGKPELEELISIGAFGGAGLALLTVLALTLQGMSMFLLSIFFSSIAMPALLIGVVVFDLAENASELLLFYNFGVFSVFIIGFFVFGFRTSGQPRDSLSSSDIMESSIPLWVAAIMSQVSMWGGQVISGMYVDSISLGQFGLALRLAMLCSFVLTAVNVYFIPKFSRLYREERLCELQSMVLLSVRLIFLFVAPIFLVMFLFAEIILGYFGNEFIAASGLLRILVLGQAVNALTGSVGFLLIIKGREVRVRNITLIVGGVSVLLMFFLTSKYGVLGAALGTAFSVIFKNLVFWYEVRKSYGFNTLAIWKFAKTDYRNTCE